MITSFIEARRRYFDIPSIARIYSFGCWNKHRNITDSIMKMINKTEYNAGIVIGDNIYTRREGGSIYLQDIADGFAILSQSRAKIYMGVGNHDVDNRNILAKELAMARLYGLEMSANWYQLGGGIMVIDTNLFYERNRIYPDYDHKMRRDMMTILRDAILSWKGRRPFIIIGHYPPAFYISSSKGERMIYMERMNELTAMLIRLNKPIVYISADAHNHQHLIMKNIHIYIGGTGGGDLDGYTQTMTRSEYTVRVNHNPVTVIVKDYQLSHGYLDISITDDKVGVSFNKVDSL